MRPLALRRPFPYEISGLAVFRRFSKAPHTIPMPAYKCARECLDAVVKRYQEMQTYSDTGMVCDRGTSFPWCWFETHYAGPSSFRFQFVTAHPYRPLHHIRHKSVIGSNKDEAYIYQHFPRSPSELRSHKSVANAINATAGISQGTSRTIGSLLIPGTKGLSLSNLRRPRFRQSREIDGVLCHCISGINPFGGRITVWIGIDDLLLRKLIKHRFHKEEVRQNILVDQPIPSEKFNIPEPAEAVNPPMGLWFASEPRR